ncbi:hypothetical protein [Leifsonia sp. 71-9]|uniref:hypothetical protein n=1 Tax=Leifsonia sp. 71-9 TaxID=1895934 RepID=UPI000928E18B|nr:hypothetical protein [Leifsonia sp. 71-9]OJX72815.1 MAG: hypothetical protein BGO91_13680 [Leifsonia sp. 71-9]
MSDDYTKLVEEARKIAAFGGFTPAHVLHALANAVEGLDRALIQEAETTQDALDERDALREARRAERRALVHRINDYRDDLRAVATENDALRAQLRTLADEFREAKAYIAAEAPHPPTQIRMAAILRATESVLADLSDPVEGEQA